MKKIVLENTQGFSKFKIRRIFFLLGAKEFQIPLTKERALKLPFYIDKSTISVQKYHRHHLKITLFGCLIKYSPGICFAQPIVATSSFSQRSDSRVIVLNSVVGNEGSGLANMGSGSHRFKACKSFMSKKEQLL
jgi:hypothetical protein